jgi:hypothetical protein
MVVSVVEGAPADVNVVAIGSAVEDGVAPSEHAEMKASRAIAETKSWRRTDVASPADTALSTPMGSDSRRKPYLGNRPVPVGDI